MKLTHVAVFLAVSSALVTLPCRAVERDLTLACVLNLNDCQSALEAAESRCAGNNLPAPSPTPPTPTAPVPTAPVAPGTLSITGDDGDPPDSFPLNICEGDCDTDTDCRGNLVCFQRDSDPAPVPGCIGTPEVDGSDYCCDTSFEGCVSTQDENEPTCGFICIIGQILTGIFGSGNRRRSLREEASVEVDGGERKLFFGVLQRECAALVERCEQQLADFSCQPTISPSLSPSLSPTKSSMPSPGPNPIPSQEPTITPKPTKVPTKRPTKRPTKAPTRRPTRPPTAAPIAQMGMGKRRDYFY